MKLLEDRNKCYGCGICAQVCPKSAIQMKNDSEGFLYPIINQNICIDCQICLNTCIIGKENYFKEKPNTFLIKNKNECIRENSSSGGFFSALAEDILIDKGSVFAVRFDSKFNVVHSEFKSFDDIKKYQKSKYVQSDMSGILDNVKKSLYDRKVLFVGTPCQVASLKKALSETEKKNLLTCDLVCRGVGSPRIWREYVDFCKIKYKNKIENFSFRSKDEGWHNDKSRIEFEDGTNDYKTNLSYGYNSLFYTNLIMRPSCSSCPFTSVTNHDSDFTLGDAWGIENHDIDFDDNKGVTLVITHTEKAKKVLKSVESKLNIKETDIENYRQPALRSPKSIPDKKHEFWKQYQTNGFERILKKYGSYGMKFEIKQLIKKVLFINRKGS